MQVCFTYLLVFVLVSTGAVMGQPVTFNINVKNKVQTIESFGASGAWYSEGIGMHWPTTKKERMAELLFSKAFDSAGNPLGIGLSAWRFNIGGGTAEQGDSSGIKNKVRRVEGFLSPDGSYDWNKQAGYVWFTKIAAKYGVEDLIAFSNTPPVQFTKNGLGFRTEKDYQTNLRDDKYVDYASFLANVLQHFDKEGLHFNYISPVNEPQWDWSAAFGQMNQEGSPWHNKDIYRITRCLDSVLLARKMTAKILITEAGDLKSLYEGKSHASRQIETFYNVASPFFLGGLARVKKAIAGHSYFTDNGDTNIIAVRNKVRDTAARYNVPFWQSEYSMLGDGCREGKSGRIPSMDCALFLAKVIHHDLTIANAAAWHWWNAWEPGNAEFNSRYYLLALQSNPANTEGDFSLTKNLWALGHYSRFVRPGMQRIVTRRSDNKNDIEAARDVMLSAFSNKDELVIVAINYTEDVRQISLKVEGRKNIKEMKQYITSSEEHEDMKPYPLVSLKDIGLKACSISTFVIKYN